MSRIDIYIHNHRRQRIDAAWEGEKFRLDLAKVAEMRRKFKASGENAHAQIGLRRLKEAEQLSTNNPAAAEKAFESAKYELPYAEASRTRDARGLNKSTIGKEAVRQLAMMAEMLKENNWRGADYHSNSANNYMKSLEAAGMQSEIPESIKRNANHLKAMGWRFPYGSV